MKMERSMEIGDSCVNPPDEHDYTDVSIDDGKGKHWGAAAFVTCMRTNEPTDQHSLAMVARMERVIAIVNAHDALVAALRRAREYVDASLQNNECARPDLVAIDAALALVEPS